MNVDKVRELLDLCEKYEYKPDQIHVNNLTEFMSENASQVSQICKTAIAALTAEPVDFRWRWARDENAVWTYCRMDKYQDAINAFDDNAKFEMVYTTPPAQLLRQVELPAKVSCDGFDIKEADEALGKGQCEGYNIGIDACAEALRHQGYEVKND